MTKRMMEVLERELRDSSGKRFAACEDEGHCGPKIDGGESTAYCVLGLVDAPAAWAQSCGGGATLIRSKRCLLLPERAPHLKAARRQTLAEPGFFSERCPRTRCYNCA